MLMAFKVPVCLARTPLLLPAALASAVVPFTHTKEGSGVDYLSSNAQADCGPPYVVTSGTDQQRAITTATAPNIGQIRRRSSA